jgi:hypothetical protein
MALIEFSIDPAVVVELILGTICTIAAVVGAIAVLKAPPKPEAILPRKTRKSLPVLAERLSMTVAAQGRMSEPLVLCFTLSDLPDLRHPKTQDTLKRIRAPAVSQIPADDT